MNIIIAGVLGFLAGILADVASLKRLSYLRTLGWLVVGVLLAYSHIAVALSTDKFRLPVPAVWLGWLCLIVGGLLLLYSLFLEIPFSTTYLGDASDQELYQQGTYALCRHPGVLWYGLLLTGLILTSRSCLALIAAPVWMFMDVLWVWTEDRFIFQEVIGGYGDYKMRTPMLVPTRESVRRCWDSLGLRYLFARHPTKDRRNAK